MGAPGTHITDAVAMTSSASGRVGVLVVDDQPAFRRAAGRLIAATSGFVQVGEAASGEAALDLDARVHPDLVLLDVRMPGMGGLEAARRLSAGRPAPVIVLVSAEAVPGAPGAYGAAAVLRKEDLSPALLMQAWQAAGGSPPNAAGP